MSQLSTRCIQVVPSKDGPLELSFAMDTWFLALPTTVSFAGRQVNTNTPRPHRIKESLAVMAN